MAALPIVGPAYKQNSLALNAQDCINLFLSADIENPAEPQKTKLALQGTPGTDSIHTFTESPCRGMISDDSFIYAVYGNKLYEFTVSSALVVAATARGTLNTSTGDTQMAQSSSHVMIVDGTNGYTYNKSTNAFAAISDVDYNDTAEIVQYVGGYFFVVDAGTDTMYSSNLRDPTAWEATDFQQAERFGDKIVALATTRGELWALGTEAIEVYTNEGTTSGFPFERVEGVDLKIGCGDTNSVLNIDDNLYWLDNRGYIVRARGYEVEVISTPPINDTISNYTAKTCYAYSFVASGYQFYCLSFTDASADTTWCYNIQTNSWNELKSGFTYNPDGGPSITNYQRRHVIQYATNYNFLQIGGSWNDGELYHISQDYKDDNGTVILRQRTSAHFFNDFKEITIGTLELQMETGSGLTTGQGSDPQVMMQYSKDRGRTWSAELWRTPGAIGKYSTRIRWNKLGTARSWTFRFRVSDPIKVTFLEASWRGR